MWIRMKKSFKKWPSGYSWDSSSPSLEHWLSMGTFQTLLDQLTCKGEWMSYIGYSLILCTCRRSYDHLISTMGFPIPVRCHLYIESGPRLIWLHTTTGPCFNIKIIWAGIGIHIIKIKWSWDCLIFIMEIPTLTKWHLYIAMAARSLANCFILCNINFHLMYFIEINWYHEKYALYITCDINQLKQSM